MSSSINTSNKDKALEGVIGYIEAVNKKSDMEKTGTDFSEDKGLVKRTIDQLHPKRIALEITDIFTDTKTTSTLRVKSKSGYLPPFQAGQYVNIFVDIEGVATARPYAISSSPLERDYYDLTVKRAEGGYVSPFLIDKTKVGQSLICSGPMGNFYHNPLFHGNDLVFLAGGSGIAPARSILKNIIDKNLPQKLHIIYSNSYEHDVIFAEEIRELSQLHNNITLTELVSRPSDNYAGIKGRITLDLLTDLLDKPESKMYYICGPTPFNEHCVDILKLLKVKERRILVELNGPPKKPAEKEGWSASVSPDDMVTITVNGEQSFQAKAGEPLLNSLERNGFSAENACRSGECSLCRIKLVSGKVFSPTESKLRKSDRKFGWIHSCVTYPNGDIEVRL